MAFFVPNEFLNDLLDRRLAFAALVLNQRYKSFIKIVNCAFDAVVVVNLLCQGWLSGRIRREIPR